MRRGSRKVHISEPVIEWAYEKWLEGYSLQDVADSLGVSRHRLNDQLTKEGYTKIKPPLKPPKEFFEGKKEGNNNG